MSIFGHVVGMIHHVAHETLGAEKNKQIRKLSTKNTNLSLIKSLYNLFGLCKSANFIQPTICTANHQIHYKKQQLIFDQISI
jgi:hypothetical protein